jgi:hypothetical protein
MLEPFKISDTNIIYHSMQRESGWVTHFIDKLSDKQTLFLLAILPKAAI